MKNRIALIAATIALALFASCSDDSESIYSHYPVSFSCDASIHPYNIVHGYGEYLIITRNGAAAYDVEWAKGKQTVRLTAQQAMFGGPLYGLGGLIIGKPMACDGNIMAFDLACPHCEEPGRTLTITHNNGVAHCEKCNSKFDLNSGGLPIEGPVRRPLWRYSVTMNDPYMIIAN